MSTDHGDGVLLYTVDDKDGLHQDEDIEEFVSVVVSTDSLVKTVSEDGAYSKTHGITKKINYAEKMSHPTNLNDFVTHMLHC